MENTVCISIEEYDNLRNFKTNIEGGKFLVIEDFRFARYEASHLYNFFTESEIVNIIAKQNKKLQSENKALSTRNKELLEHNGREVMIHDSFEKRLMGMTWWDFRKWRNRRKKMILKCL